jgi:hypothetical protein
MAAGEVYIPELGTVTFVVSKQAKRLSISVRPFRGVRVTFPRRLSLSKAKELLAKNLDWAANALKEARKIETLYPPSKRLRIAPHERDKARAFLQDRLLTLAGVHGFACSGVSVRNQKTRWGSCSDKNRINLNISLMGLSGQLRDYVILHELVHTKIKNHSRRFWECLDGICGGQAKKLDKELKKYRIGFF